MIADVDVFADGLLLGFSQLFTGVVTILGTLIFMLTLSPLITLVVVVLTPLSLFVARFIASRTYNMFLRQSETPGLGRGVHWTLPARGTHDLGAHALTAA